MLGSKDPQDWNIRVRGWAFSKRSNRRKRLVMSMARKLAGVTKDNKVYDTLESRFGMFLASNTQGARFSIQCVGLAKTNRMELAGDPASQDPTVNVLLDEMKTPEGALAAEEAVRDKARLRKSLEEDRDGILQMSSNPPSPAAKSRHIIESAVGAHKEDQRSQHSSPPPEHLPQESWWEQSHRSQPTSKHSDYIPSNGVPPTKVTAPDAEGSLVDRWSKGAAFVKGAYRKYKPVVMAQISSNNSVDSLRTIPDQSNYERTRSGNSTRANGSLSDYSRGEAVSDLSMASTHATGPPPNVRSDSGDSMLSQTMTHNEDLGHGSFPTVQIMSKPGGHFDGTLRVSLNEVDTQRKREGGGHRRFLKLHAYHPEMTEACHGIVNLIDPEGISIISDIDDTIKETNVSAGARIILRNTFLKDMRDVPGMASTYNRWWKRGAAIHYVSNSPWQLIPSLLEFFHSHKFPPGSAHLRLHDSVLKTYFTTPGEHKRRSIKEIMADFPDRKFILVGDSGEIDMEIYTDVALAHPNQVFKIFIRDISTARLKEEALKMPPPKASSFTSMLPKAPITAVTTGFGFFSRQGNQTPYAVVEHTTQDGQAQEDQTQQPVQSLDEFYNVDKESGSTLSLSQPTIQNRNGSSVSPAPAANAGSTLQTGYPFPPTSEIGAEGSGSTVAEAPLIDFSSDELPKKPEDDAGSGRESPTPGALPSAPVPNQAPVTKNPYELWMERIEICERKLPSGMLTFFESTDVLEQDILVNALFENYGVSGASTPRSEDGQDFEDISDDDHHLHLHHLHHHHQQQQRRQDSNGASKGGGAGSPNSSASASGRSSPVSTPQ
ncbi:hypothetical protein BG004_004826 [Podila humilis]|nr:hypothetical protein BG004_004826 [Podila humilis]